MRSVLFYLLSYLIVVSCSFEHLYNSKPYDPNSLNSEQTIRLVYRGEKNPEREYIVTSFFDLYLRGDIPSEECLEILNQKAHIVKVDAVIDIHEHVDQFIRIIGNDSASSIPSIVASTRKNRTFYHPETMCTRVTGKGIKYVENLNHSGLIKTQDLYLINKFENDKDLKVASIHRDVSGKIISVDCSSRSMEFFVHELIIPFSDYSIFEDVDRSTFILDKHGRLKRRVKLKKESREEYLFNYNNKGILNTIRYKNHKTDKSVKINLEYSRDSRIILKRIKVGGRDQVIVKNKYRFGKLVYQDIQYFHNHEIMDLYMLNSFFNENEITNFLKENKQKPITIY